MGLLAKIICDASDTEFKLAQDLVAMAIADGEISEEELEVIKSISQKEGISNDVVNDYLMGFDKEEKTLVPEKQRDKIDYVSKLIMVMGADGESSHIEIYLLEIIASKMGISHMQLVSLVLMTASRKFFHGDKGSKILASFLRNVIDPKGKSLRDNRDNVRIIFDTMAENIPQLQNEDADRLAFMKAMNTATELLTENTLLCNEFRSMGIDFETVLMAEREDAIRRWVL